MACSPADSRTRSQLPAVSCRLTFLCQLLLRASAMGARALRLTGEDGSIWEPAAGSWWPNLEACSAVTLGRRGQGLPVRVYTLSLLFHPLPFVFWVTQAQERAGTKMHILLGRLDRLPGPSAVSQQGWARMRAQGFNSQASQLAESQIFG